MVSSSTSIHQKKKNAEHHLKKEIMKNSHIHRFSAELENNGYLRWMSNELHYLDSAEAPLVAAISSFGSRVTKCRWSRVWSLWPPQSHICGPNYFELEIGLYGSVPIVYVNCYFFHFGCSSGRVIRKIIMYIVKNNTFELPEINCQHQYFLHFFDSSKLTYKIIQQTVLCASK